jgi:acyl-CoA thioesterase
MDQIVEQEVVDKIKSDPFAGSLGIKFLEIKKGYSKVSLTIKQDMLNFHGIAHGGVIFSLADAAFGAAGNSYGQTAVAMSMEINYRRPVAVGSILYAEAKEESFGKRTALYHMTVTTDEGKLIASCHGTVYRKQ